MMEMIRALLMPYHLFYYLTQRWRVMIDHIFIYKTPATPFDSGSPNCDTTKTAQELQEETGQRALSANMASKIPQMQI